MPATVEARYIAFASNSISFDSLDALTQVSVSNHAGHGGRDAIDQSETNIASALDGALHHFAPDHLKRLVLISDGNETSGNVAEMLPRLRQEHVPVFTLPLESRSDQDAWIETVRTPSKVTADEQFPVEVQIFSSSNTIGEVEIRNGSTVLARRTAVLEKGLNRIAFETSIASSTGTVMLEATVTIAGDPRLENNIFRRPWWFPDGREFCTWRVIRRVHTTFNPLWRLRVSPWMYLTSRQFPHA